MAVPSSDPNKTKTGVSEASFYLLAALRKTGGKAFKPLGLTSLEAMVLIFIEKGHTQTTELGSLLGVVLPGVSAVTARMVESGFITKEAAQADHRQVQLGLTHKGRRMCRKIEAAWATHSPIDTSAFTDEEISVFIRVGRSLV